MPSTSKKQHNFMAAVAKNPKFAKKVGVPQSVGEEFLTADKGKKFREGGTMKDSKAMAKKEIAFMEKKGAPKSMIKHEKAEYGMKKGGMTCAKGGNVHSDIAQDKPMMKKVAKEEVKKHEKSMHGMKKGGMAYAKGGVTRADGIVKKGHTKGMQVAMKRGGKC